LKTAALAGPIDSAPHTPPDERCLRVSPGQMHEEHRPPEPCALEPGTAHKSCSSRSELADRRASLPKIGSEEAGPYSAIGSRGSLDNRLRSVTDTVSSSAQVAAVISSLDLGVFAVAAAGVLCAFSCVVDALPEQCLRRRLAQILLSLLFLEPSATDGDGEGLRMRCFT
jgi:hypothetical protein